MFTNIERIKRYLHDLRAAEKDVDRALWSHVRDRHAPDELRDLCEEAVCKSRKRCMAIEQRLIDLGASSHEQVTRWGAISSRAKDLWSTEADSNNDPTTAALRVHAAGCYLNASYYELSQFMKTVGDTDCANLAKQGEEENAEMADKLIPIIEQLSAQSRTPQLA